MKVNVFMLSLATAATFTLLWIVCSLMVMLMPEFMQHTTASMLHIEPADITWNLSWRGVLMGCVSWAVVSAVAVALLATLYRLFGNPSL